MTKETTYRGQDNRLSKFNLNEEVRVNNSWRKFKIGFIWNSGTVVYLSIKNILNNRYSDKLIGPICVSNLKKYQ
ncbi:hypothetical protein COB55_03385 [Candidatus Wolfebacteria bacterium]|nr:MAG: hypothetical protein COB55_03385 [Candidatus Wolfebacteria bacterium]